MRPHITADHRSALAPYDPVIAPNLSGHCSAKALWQEPLCETRTRSELHWAAPAARTARFHPWLSAGQAKRPEGAVGPSYQSL